MSHKEQTNEERYRQGRETLVKMVGEEGTRTIEGIRTFFPDFGDMLVSFGFGDLYSRKRLDLRQREIITLTSLITQGATDQLGFHVHAALNVGLEPEDILEIVMHCAGYAGFPKACGALNVVMAVFQERSIELKLD
ncbi:carboxymuconolactone decarboxylase family protein [Paenibacillus mucilaginosus]|uniref:Carboxymuconolactone decarboxylase n=1 Tax=Paenibacillus mucilaginosus (strain KNP414) TaxID=1036673 RepID=F8F837_PAEMK|nr:carboxymuconolactone decarboxylase family protein [Paenibacillus mucilaginosus]AEI41022.1 carboxymuconolactone decarboxylase [Paenibacillus mucilaginosus KNP414]MCG7211534.1 carboxymuconolactone decarboxylase family protein [Paenibacillus mucilaginosus]WDM30092.1 carboxymuconolactone decarboxylase family protein [Paenibacillus mucilaginosus]